MMIVPKDAHLYTDAARKEKLDPTHYYRFKRRIRKVGTPLAFQPADLNKYPEWIQNKVKLNKSLFITGNDGTGKTRLMYAIAEWIVGNTLQIPAMDDQFGDRGFIRFYTSSGILQMIKNTFGKRPEEYESETGTPDNGEILKKCHYLFIDDLGVEKQTEWAFEELFNIVDFRYAWRLPMIISSNLTLKELGEGWSKRIVRRIMESGDIIELTK